MQCFNVSIILLKKHTTATSMKKMTFYKNELNFSTSNTDDSLLYISPDDEYPMTWRKQR